MSIRSTYTAAIRGRETIDVTETSAIDPSAQYTYAGLNTIELVFNAQEAVSLDVIGTQTIDLTVVGAARNNKLAIDLTGLKLIATELKAPSTNTGAMTIAPGAATPYPFPTIELNPGESAVVGGIEATVRAAVAAGAKNLDISGAGGDQLLGIAYFGP